jgi:hypothetical protein
MSNYKIKEGSSQALIDLVLIAPQPKSPGVQATRTTHSADGTPHWEGLYVSLSWDLVSGYSQLDDILDQFGLDVATKAAVTIYAPNQLQVYTRYNGLAIRPQVSRRNYFIRDVSIIIRDLVAL